MIALDTAQLAQSQASTYGTRLFLLLEIVDTGESPAAMLMKGFWEGVSDITVDSQLYVPFGCAVEAPPVQQVSDGSLPGYVLGLAGEAGTAVADLLLNPSIQWHQKSAQVFTALFDPLTDAIVGGLLPESDGYLDKAPMTVATTGEASKLTLYLEPVAREMTASNPAVRSHYDQTRTYGSDDGLEFAGRDQTVPWGTLVKRTQIRQQRRRQRFARRQRD